MIYIVEIPHQLPASVWFAYDEKDALHRINDDLASRHCAEEAEDFEEAIKINGSDLHAQYVLNSDEAREALRNEGMDWSPHQRWRAMRALRQAMTRAGELNDEESPTEYGEKE